MIIAPLFSSFGAEQLRRKFKTDALSRHLLLVKDMRLIMLCFSES